MRGLVHILVTGGCGFIGSRLVSKLLDLGHSIVVLDNLSSQIHGALPNLSFPWAASADVRVVRGDIATGEGLDEALDGVESIAHLAAETGTGQSMYQIARYNAVNTQGTALLLERMIALKAPVKRFVLSSSRSIYGDGSYLCTECGTQQTPATRPRADLEAGKWEPSCIRCRGTLKPVPTHEDAPIRPASIYAATKVAQEDLVRIACEAAGVAAVSLRFQNVYGEGQSLKNPYTGIISIFSTRIRRSLSLPIYEDGEESRDFVHVDDVVAAVAQSLLQPLSGYSVFNIGAGEPTSVMTLACTLAKAMGSSVEPIVTGEFRLGDIRHCYADISAARDAIGFTPKIGLEEGLRRFAAWALSEPLEEDRLDRAVIELRARGLMSQAHS
jgi:dTDP-L-rhamnose 4-epimerase